MLNQRAYQRPRRSETRYVTHFYEILRRLIIPTSESIQRNQIVHNRRFKIRRIHSPIYMYGEVSKTASFHTVHRS
jgi:hypothetical protein